VKQSRIVGHTFSSFEKTRREPQDFIPRKWQKRLRIKDQRLKRGVVWIGTIELYSKVQGTRY